MYMYCTKPSKENNFNSSLFTEPLMFIKSIVARNIPQFIITKKTRYTTLRTENDIVIRKHINKSGDP